MNLARFAAIEAACIAGHLGDWRSFQPAAAAYERGLQFAASRYAALPDAPCHASRRALHAEALSQALDEAGGCVKRAPSVQNCTARAAADFSADDHRRAVLDCFNAINAGADLAGELAAIGAQLAPTAEQPSASRRPQPVKMYWPFDWAQNASHTQPHWRR